MQNNSSLLLSAAAERGRHSGWIHIFDLAQMFTLDALPNTTLPGISRQTCYPLHKK